MIKIKFYLFNNCVAWLPLVSNVLSTRLQFIRTGQILTSEVCKIPPVKRCATRKYMTNKKKIRKMQCKNMKKLCAGAAYTCDLTKRRQKYK